MLHLSCPPPIAALDPLTPHPTPRPTPRLQLLQDVRALRATCQVQPDGQLDLECLVDQLHDLGYACYLKHSNPGGCRPVLLPPPPLLPLCWPSMAACRGWQARFHQASCDLCSQPSQTPASAANTA